MNNFAKATIAITFCYNLRGLESAFYYTYVYLFMLAEFLLLEFILVS